MTSCFGTIFWKIDFMSLKGKGGIEMNSKEIVARVETRTSKKGNTYTAIFVKITPTYEKICFLNASEIELLKSQGIVPKVVQEGK